MHIVIIDDQKILSRGIKKKLIEHNYEVTLIHSYAQYTRSSPGKVDLYIIDISLGDGTGLDIIKRLKKNPKTQNIPILMISGHSDIELKLSSFDLGADDYLVKPFNPQELIARVEKRIEDKTQEYPQEVEILYKNISFHKKSRMVTVNGMEIHLSKKKKSILEFFLLRQNILITKEELSDSFWKTDNPYCIVDNTMNVTLCDLRKKMGQMFDLQTISGEGYILKK